MELQQLAAVMQNVFAAALVVACPFLGLHKRRHLRQFSSTVTRIALYRGGIASEWVALCIAVIVTPINQLIDVKPQLGALPWLEGFPVVRAAMTALLIAFFALALWPGARGAFDQHYRSRMAKALRTLLYMAPVSRNERIWFALLSITAGICEELLYRGFLLQYLRGHLESGPSFSFTTAWCLSSLAFGLAHFYQGTAGIVRTGMAGLMLGLLAIMTGTLLWPIVIHCILDLQFLLMYRPSRDRPEAAAALITGCCPTDPSIAG